MNRVLVGSVFTLLLSILFNYAEAQTAPPFSLSLEPSHRAIVQGGSQPVAVQIARGRDFTGSVSLSLANAPNGVAGTFSRNPVTGPSTKLILRVAQSVPLGTYRLTIRGTANGSLDTPLELKVAPPLPLPTVILDPILRPDFTSLPGGQAGRVRSVTCLSDDQSHKAHFVDDEVIVSTDSATTLAAFLSRWHGRVLSIINRERDSSAPATQHYLVHIDPAAAQQAGLAVNIHKANPNATGVLLFCDQNGLKLFAVVAQEAADGLAIELNWVMQNSSGFLSGISTEDTNGPANFDGSPYNSNVFTWRHMNGVFGFQSGDPGIGVTHAWQGLEFAGKLKNKVKVAIIEGDGFAPNGDFPPGFQAVSIIPNTAALNFPNTAASSGGSVVPWHGTMVTEALAGVANNGFGAAGTAGGGPNADLILISSTLDFFTTANAVLTAQAMGAKIINMSFESSIPAIATFGSVQTFEDITNTARNSGVLIFASAGNSGQNVDEEVCFIACWETTWYSPCENDGVICVGGLAPNSRNRAPASNYGSGNVGDVSTVDIYAPYSVLVGPDPASGPGARWVSGTSFSSPYVAGVAALVWAANPALTADQVENILYSTAMFSGDPTVNINRVVFADAAVRAALGGNVSPIVTITAPTDGSQIEFGGFNSIALKAIANDFEDGMNCCKLTWTSSNFQDNVFANGTPVSISLGSPGPRKITVTAKDSGGAKGSASINLIGVDMPPSVKITKPTPGEIIYHNVSRIFSGGGSDPDEPGGQLPCVDLTWTSNQPGDQKLTGCNPDFKFTTLGSRTLTLTGTDPQGKSGQTTVAITVVDPPASGPPLVTITQPIDDSVFWPSENAPIAGIAVGKGPFSYAWKMHIQGGYVPVNIKEATYGQEEVKWWTPSDYLTKRCGDSSNDLWLYATDVNGLTGSDHVKVSVSYGAC
jgi:serine protease